MKTLIAVLFVCTGCSTTFANQKPAHEVYITEHMVSSNSSGHMVVCTMRCVSDVDCSVVECQ